jgi:signal transduction histidine kinase
VYLSELRRQPGAALQLRRPLHGIALLPDQSFDFGYVTRGRDYRGVEVLGVVRRIPDSHWFLVAKIDIAEVDAPVVRLGWELALLALLIAVTNVAVARSIWRAEELAQRRRHEYEVQLLSGRLLNAQEDERSRLARELHDDLSQQIAAISLVTGNLKRLIRRDPDDAAAECDRIHQKLVGLSECIRRMSHQLHPAVLELSGLPSALRVYCKEFEALNGIQVTVTADATFDRVPPGVALGLYRIAQEALQNVARHSGAKEARITLEQSDDWLRLTISDKGAGMSGERDQPPRGLGLISMRERALLLGGTVEMVSRLGQGTVISVRVPL